MQTPKGFGTGRFNVKLISPLRKRSFDSMASFENRLANALRIRICGIIMLHVDKSDILLITQIISQ